MLRNKMKKIFFLVKIINKALKSTLGRKNWQGFYEKLHDISLTGMNIGKGSGVQSSGEIFCLNYVKEKLSEQKITIFDVGANVGDYALMAQKFFGETADIFCFEPSMANFEKLLINAKGVKNIKTYHFGLGEKNEKMILFMNEKSSSLASLYQRQLAHFNLEMNLKETVEIRTLDDFCAQNNIKHIHLLKLDAEGHEFKILKGAGSMIEAGNVDFIQFEFGGCDIDSHTFFQDFYYWLVPKYKIFRILKNGLYPINKYRETNEIFITTNYLAEKQ